MLRNRQNLFSNVNHSNRYRQLVIKRKTRKIMRFRQGNRTGLMKTFTYENQYIRLANTVEPLWRKPYEDQLSIKKYKIEQCMQKVFNILTNEKRVKIEDSPIVHTMETQLGKKMCEVKDVIPSPVTKGYRNKDTVNPGPDIKGDRRTLGLYVGSVYDKTMTCVQVYFLSIIKERHKEIIKVLQDFIYQSSYEPKFMADRDGNWKSMIIRSTSRGQVMLIFTFHPQRNSQDFIDGAKEEILQYFVHGPGKQLGIDSIYFQSSWLNKPNPVDFPFELLHGIPTIMEHLLDLKFQISPDSFFQGNTQCAELLYSTTLDLGKVSPETTVLDICCGTGTIGIIAAKRAKRVLGVEITPKAIEDAKINAQINGITNTEFICNKAHRMLREVVNDDVLKDEEDVVAILNPSRSGVNKKLIESIRNCPKIKRVVYISCKPIGNVLQNFSNLIRPPNETYIGEPFTPIVAVPVDMFPQTLHCEVVVSFER